MSLPTNLNDVKEINLQYLVDSGTEESRELDFKEEVYGARDQDKVEFLKDVCAFANTMGGRIIIGIREVDGIASELVGIKADVDNEIRRLEQLALSRIRPRLRMLRFQAVFLSGDRCCLIVEVERSLNPPHAFVNQESHRYVIRFGRHTQDADVDQLRQLFLVAPSLVERTKSFISERLNLIGTRQTRIDDPNSGIAVFHCIPLTSLEGRIALSTTQIEQSIIDLKPLVSGNWEYRFTLEGLLTVSPNLTGPRDAHNLLWRDGRIEFVNAALIDAQASRPTINAAQIEELAVLAMRSSLVVFEKASLLPPWFVVLSLVQMGDVHYKFAHVQKEEPRSFDRDFVVTSGIMIEQLPESDLDSVIAALLRPMFDELANAAGWRASLNFMSGGAWLSRTRWT